MLTRMYVDPFIVKALLRNEISVEDRERLRVEADIVIHTPQAGLVFFDAGRGRVIFGDPHSPRGLSRSRGDFKALYALVAANGRVLPWCLPTQGATRQHLVRAAKAIGRVHAGLGEVLQRGIHVTKRGAFFEQQGDELPVRIDCTQA